MEGYRFRLAAFLIALVSVSTRTQVTAFVTSNPLEAPTNLHSVLPSAQGSSPPCRPSDSSRREYSRLFSQSNNDNDSAPSSPRVKFSSDFAGDDSSSLENPLDQLLSFVASDAFSIVSGILGLLAVVSYRWNLVLSADPSRATAEALTYETRTDLLGVLAAGSVLLNGVTKLDVTTALAESVVLEGKTLSEPEQIGTDSSGGSTLVWALESLLAATPAKTAVLISDSGDQWSIQCRAGIVPSSDDSLSLPEKTPILERVGAPQNSKETYLPTLQALPGKTELTYLPNNAQMAVMIPIRPSTADSSIRNSVLVLGGNTAKSFTPRDIAWSRIVAEKIGEEL